MSAPARSSLSLLEPRRLAEDERREKNWKRWGPYLSERQWGTVREDYSATGECWTYFPHEHARSRAYRWGEDGLLGITDRECRLCFAPALWNGRDPFLKERLFGLTNPEGNHGEDVKECYHYLDALPTSRYLKALYKYPQAEFPYERLRVENRRRGLDEREFEIEETGLFEGGRYFDVVAEYAKIDPDHLLIRLSATNRGPEMAVLHLLPTLWFRNTWTWGCRHDGCTPKPSVEERAEGKWNCRHDTLGQFELLFSAGEGETLFTENETNNELLYRVANASPYVKDAFHRHVVEGETAAVNPRKRGTKAALHAVWELAPGETRELCLQLRPASPARPISWGAEFAREMSAAREETDAYYASLPGAEAATPEERTVVRQGYAGLLWSKQFYHYAVGEWLAGDPEMPPPPRERLQGRNHEWGHLFSRDVISMPDKWEYPWFAAWDLAFHMIPFARIDPSFAKQQLVLFLREWYMHANGQIPAYEFALGDVNPPVHAWAAWRVYKMSAPRGSRDRGFLESVFQKLLLNFTWWVNRKDAQGKGLFAGGFLGLDNIGVFDRSKPLPAGGDLQQADGTAWMAFFCSTMLSMALELAYDDGQLHVAYEDMASKFFEHFVQIVDAMNSLGGTGLWDEEEGFYYDQLACNGQTRRLRTRSLVGLLPLIAVEILDREKIERTPGFKKRFEWFMRNRPDLSRHIVQAKESAELDHEHALIAVVTRERLVRVLNYLFDENEFLSPYGVRSLSKVHADRPFLFELGGESHRVDYAPAESRTRSFGGNSNWRGPVWFPTNYLIVEALERYHEYYRDTLKVELPTGSGRYVTLREASLELQRRLASLFLPGPDGSRPCQRETPLYREDEHARDLVLFHEYFHAETGRGCGASHQTGWTALAVRCLEELARARQEKRTGTIPPGAASAPVSRA